MKIYVKTWETVITGNLDDIWQFFSRPENLERITPADMSFEILTDLKGVEMYSGMLIQYKVKPFSFMKTDWVTEITFVQKHSYFIDEQRVGPFSLWHHEHHFEEVSTGILMRDILHYALPFGPVGRILNRTGISRRIDRIFDHRESVIQEIYPRIES